MESPARRCLGVIGCVLHARSVILGLNPGDSRVERRPWQIFHTGPRRNDAFLAEAFSDTEHWVPTSRTCSPGSTRNRTLLT